MDAEADGPADRAGRSARSAEAAFADAAAGMVARAVARMGGGLDPGELADRLVRACRRATRVGALSARGKRQQRLCLAVDLCRNGGKPLRNPDADPIKLIRRNARM